MWKSVDLIQRYTKKFETLPFMSRNFWKGVFNSVMHFLADLNIKQKKKNAYKICIPYLLCAVIVKGCFNCVMRFPNNLYSIYTPFTVSKDEMTIFWFCWKVFNNLCVMHDFPFLRIIKFYFKNTKLYFQENLNAKWFTHVNINMVAFIKCLQ